MKTDMCIRGVLVAWLTVGSACAVIQGALSQPPTIEARAWQHEFVLAEPAGTELGSPAVLVDPRGHPVIAFSDRALYMGMTSIAVARRSDEGWQVEFPVTPSTERVCARAQEDFVVVTYGEWDKPAHAIAWDSQQATKAAPEACPPQTADTREVSANGGIHRIERSNDRRTLWHRALTGASCPPHDADPGFVFDSYALAIDPRGRPHIVGYERPTQDEMPGRVRHAQCVDQTWTSSIVARDVEVSAVGLHVDLDGRPHVAFVEQRPDQSRLRYAVPIDTNPLAPVEQPRDSRIDPALDACIRERSSKTRRTPGIEGYQSGDGFRCAVLERDDDLAGGAQAQAQARCDAKEAGACAVAGALHHRLMGTVDIVLEHGVDGSRWIALWDGGSLRHEEGQPGPAAKWYGRACELGDRLACRHAAVLLPESDPQRRPWAALACEDGQPSGCALMIGLGGIKPDSAAMKRAVTVLEDACAAGDPIACGSVGVTRLRRADAVGAREALGRACDAGIEPACRSLTRLP